MTTQNQQEIQSLFDEAWALIGKMHENRSLLDEANTIYKRILSMDPNNKDIHWKIAEVTFKKADLLDDKGQRTKGYHEAIEWAKKNFKYAPNSPEAHYWLGCTSARLAEMSGIVSGITLVKEAMKSLEKCIEIDSNNRFATLSKTILSAIYIALPWPLKDVKKAEKLAKEAVEKDPNLTMASEKLASVYIYKKAYQQARQELESCLAIKTPTYIWDSVIYDWPTAKRLLKEIEGHK
ncbi:MAG: hypothetical protein HQK77_02745 [Desulfobacterales bacterium]|nr:hypothetical protein [Desulfobacterales bacterium]